MENGHLQHPNSNADFYRSLERSDRPPAPVKYLQFVAIHEDGTAIVGGSNMTDRYWTGKVWFFNDTTTFQRDIGHPTANTVCDAAFLDSRKFLLSEDGGSLQVLTVNDSSAESWSNSCFVSTSYACHHYDSITSIAVFNNQTKFLTCGKDLAVKVWALDDFIPVYSYETAHAHKITSIDVMPKSESVFLSTSMDDTVTVWDTNKTTPAYNLFKYTCGLSASSWSPCNEHRIAVGAVDGTVIVLDTRVPGKPISQSSVFPRETYKLKFHSKREHVLAGCCDDVPVKVLDTSGQLSEIYCDIRHTDFVHGIAWDKDELVSCAWDNTIIKHQINF